MILMISLFVVEVLSGFCSGMFTFLFISSLKNPGTSLSLHHCYLRRWWWNHFRLSPGSVLSGRCGWENGDVAGSSLKGWFLKQPIYSYLYIIIYLIPGSGSRYSWYEECVATKVCPHLHGDDDAYGFFVPGTWNIYGKVKVESLTFSVNFFGVMKTLELRVASTWVIECTTCEHQFS